MKVQLEKSGCEWIPLLPDSLWGYKASVQNTNDKNNRALTGRLRAEAWGEGQRVARLRLLEGGVHFIGAPSVEPKPLLKSAMARRFAESRAKTRRPAPPGKRKHSR